MEIDLEKEILSLMKDNEKLNNALNRACDLFQSAFTVERLEMLQKGYLSPKAAKEMAAALEAFSSRQF
jgi:hypothetical protein